MLFPSIALIAASVPLSLAGVTRSNPDKSNGTARVKAAGAGEEDTFRIAGPIAQLPTPPGTTPFCTWYIDNTGGENCKTIPALWDITMADFVRWNPTVKTNCDGFVAGFSYCVEAYGEPPLVSSSSVVSSTTTTSATTASTTSTISSNIPASTTSSASNGIATPDPIQPGIVGNCDAFHQVKSGDTCDVLASTYGVSVKQLTTWNPEIGSSCQSMWLDYYICVSVVGVEPTKVPASSTSTAPGNGISTPTPAQPGMVSNCDAFHKVKSGDNCAALASTYGITVPQLTTWNKEIGSNCQTIWLDYYICVSIVGVSPTKPSSTSTKPGNGIATPTPTQPGIVSNCDAFHKVKSGDTCAALASTYGISIAQLTTWNSQIGSSCQSIWLDYYICVSVVGVEPTKTSTKPGNGVATPTPTQAGMTGNCKKFYKVKSGDTCATIAKAAGISVANFISWNSGVGSGCTSLWLDTYYCTGL